MRIVHLVTSGDLAGGQVVALQLAHAARARGDEVAFVSPTDGPFVERVRAEGFRAFRVDASRLFRLGGTLALVRLLRRERADVLHTHTHLAAAVNGRVAARLAGAAVVSHLHIENHFRPQASLRAVSRALDNATARWCARLVAVSESTRDAFAAQGFPQDLLETVYNGVELNGPVARSDLRGELGLPADAFVVAHVGRLAPVKGQRELLRALAQVPGVYAVLVGEDVERGGAYRAELEQEATRLGGRAFFLGRRDVGAILTEVDALVLPSRIEGLPIVVLEAMARAKPVVATPVGGTPELVVDGETGRLVEIDELAETLAWLRDNLDETRRMGEAGRRRAEERFGIEPMTSRVLEIYDEALGRR
jgi:glycosyltransferase involved in cell wall biosynthesis